MSSPATDLNPLTSDALIVARVVDAATGQPRPVLTARTADAHAYAHIASGSFLVLSGRPELAVPGLAAASRELSSQLRFSDRPPLSLAFTIPAGTELPFRPADVQVELPPTSLSGTVAAQAFPQSPIAGATVEVTAATTPPALVGLRTPLSVSHPAAAPVSACTATAGAAATSLIQPAAQGEQTLTLASTAGFVSGGAVILGSDYDQEHVIVTTVDGAQNQVGLATPLWRSRPANTPAQAYMVTIDPPSTTLAREASPGDGLLELAGTEGANLIGIGGPTSELRATGAVSDQSGNWRVEGVRAIGQLTLTVNATGYASAGPLAYDVDYRQPNVIDFSLT